MPTLEELDKNFKIETADENGLIYRSCTNETFTLYGFSSPGETGVFSRLPLSFSECEDVSIGVRSLMLHTSGGRVRFRTDSKVIAIKGQLGDASVWYHMPITNSHGFDLYSAPADTPANLIFNKNLSTKAVLTCDKTFSVSHEFDHRSLREITINFPSYNSVKSLYIGLEDNCVLEKATPYSIEKPIVYYGSSISQGGCSSRPGTNYINLLSRWLDADFINLGFSGNDKGEEALAHHIASLNMSVFVYAYGHNTPSIEHYENTYYPFYKIIREQHPELPIVFMSPPICPQLKNTTQLERYTKINEIVIKSYETAKQNDENVYFIDGFKLLENPESTVDTTHPNDVGFHEMAQKIYPILKNILDK